MGYRMDVLASNDLLDALMPGLIDDPAKDTDIVRFVFVDESSRDLHLEWDLVAEETAAMLRFHAGRHPNNPDLSRLVGDLSMSSKEFARCGLHMMCARAALAPTPTTTHSWETST